MRVAAVYDIHGNLPALDAVLEDIRRAHVDHIVVGGDVVPGPMPRETLDRLLGLEIETVFIQGNGDREIVATRRGMLTGAVPERFRGMMRWVADELTPDDEQLLAGWPPTTRLVIPGLGDVLFCHATPRNDTDIFTRETPEERLLPIFERAEADVVVCGHTHMQFDRTVGSVRVVNAGSVGMPFEEPGAYWLLAGPTIELRRTAYDLEAAAARVRQTRYPDAEEFADRNILRSPTAADTLAAFAKVDLK